MPEYYMGLLSGTSMDAIDAAIVDFAEHPPKLVATLAKTIPDQLKSELRALCSPGDNEINRLGQADVMLGELFAETALNSLTKAKLTLKDIKAIGSHGQTIRHQPNLKTPFTLQIGDPNVIAARTGIPTVADFRRKDMALGGQGAPLAPAFHTFLFRNTDRDCFVVNIGGIANLTYLPKDPRKPVVGFDTGPGNTLMDSWAKAHTNKDYDNNGDWANTGNLNNALLSQLLSDSYFKQPYPKSTGPEYFNLDWLNQHDINHSPEDIQRTLLELTAKSMSNDIRQFANTGAVSLCGGGANNTLLQHCISQELTHFTVNTTDELGLPGDWLEAMLFAWLAKCRLAKEPIDLSFVTGAKKQAHLGGVYS